MPFCAASRDAIGAFRVSSSAARVCGETKQQRAVEALPSPKYHTRLQQAVLRVQHVDTGSALFLAVGCPPARLQVQGRVNHVPCDETELQTRMFGAETSNADNLRQLPLAVAKASRLANGSGEASRPPERQTAPRTGKPPLHRQPAPVQANRGPRRQTAAAQANRPPRRQTGRRRGKPPPPKQTGLGMADHPLYRQTGLGLANRRCAGIRAL